ncbi:MAG: hypothetical protein ACI92O_000356 [Colwellia sp.]|jgi:hypothetical protein
MNKEQLLTEINNYDLSFVEAKFIMEYPELESESGQLLTELKKWLYLCFLHPEKTYSMCGNVDKIWHTFILFTYEYRQFCYSYGEFIHHVPDMPTPNKNNKNSNKDESPIDLTDYVSFLEDYKKEFENPDSTIWPLPEIVGRHPQCHQGGGGGCKRCQRNCHRSCGRK